jgi:hypothetical protein
VVGDIGGGVEGVGEGGGDGVPGLSLEVVEAGHQGCHFEGESLAVIEKVRADDVVLLVEAAVGRRRGNGEVVLGEGVVSAGKELLEVAETLEAVLVIEGESGVLKQVAPRKSSQKSCWKRSQSARALVSWQSTRRMARRPRSA